ncbi:serine/threonine-protein phosphatase [Permianibacter sp. IMCC34836]|uniref:PP2C family protein-serine/threonine phosphatase n=1 Tax=Permianibacter fluminis TaxID=2738515 RepID=UPI0015529F17|nr:PP2C family serine/threonine-protein phosphatase [Permianibacter fluminis]NQD35859.1 serine/threonine-protein phosphatase [Permianibacter fluminis]
MTMIRLQALTDVGRVRSGNEDCVFADPGGRFAVLADGMGGANAGEVASHLAVDTIRARLTATLAHQQLPVVDELQEQLLIAIEEAQRQIRTRASRDPQCAGMGTTVVAAVINADQLIIAHVGDSRLYRLRGGEFKALTKDHSLVQLHVDQGLLTAEEARSSSQKNILLQVLGSEQMPVIATAIHQLADDDRYLLCSDGLNDLLSDHEIGALLGNKWLGQKERAQALVDAANQLGGRDNVSVVLIDVGDGDASSGWRDKLKQWWR